MVQENTTERDRIITEKAAIDLLMNYGTTFKVQVTEKEAKSTNNNWMKRLLVFRKERMPKGIEVAERLIPDPIDPDKTRTIYEACIRIRPLYLITIDAIRAERLHLEMKDSKVSEILGKNSNDNYLLKYTDEVVRMVVLAILNDGDRDNKKIGEWCAFLKRRLNSNLLLKLSYVVISLMDTQSFTLSTKLIMGVSATTPTEANLVERQK